MIWLTVRNAGESAQAQADDRGKNFTLLGVAERPRVVHLIRLEAVRPEVCRIPQQSNSRPSTAIESGFSCHVLMSLVNDRSARSRRCPGAAVANFIPVGSRAGEVAKAKPGSALPRGYDD